MDLIETIEKISEQLEYDQQEAFKKGGKVSSNGEFSYEYLDLGTGNSYKAHGKVVDDSVIIRESKLDTNCGQELVQEESVLFNNVAGEYYKLYKSHIKGAKLASEIEEDKKIIDALYDNCEEVIGDIKNGKTSMELEQKYNVEIGHKGKEEKRIK